MNKYFHGIMFDLFHDDKNHKKVKDQYLKISCIN